MAVKHAIFLPLRTKVVCKWELFFSRMFPTPNPWIFLHIILFLSLFFAVQKWTGASVSAINCARVIQSKAVVLSAPRWDWYTCTVSRIMGCVYYTKYSAIWARARRPHPIQSHYSQYSDNSHAVVYNYVYIIYIIVFIFTFKNPQCIGTE